MWTSLLPWARYATVAAAVAMSAAAGYGFAANRSAARLEKARSSWALERQQAAERQQRLEADYREREQRITEQQREIADDADRKIQALRVDSADARAAADRLRERVATIAASARKASCNPTASERGKTASDPAGLLARMLGEIDAAAGEFAEAADAARVSGNACVSAYEALRE